VNDLYQIALENIEVSYPLDGGACKTILNDIDLFIRAGELVTVVGPSGCGKSTVLRLILGSQFPTRGTAQIDGEPVSQVNRDRGIVYQRYSLFPHLTVVENIAFGLELQDTTLPQRCFFTRGYRQSRRRSREQAREFLKRVGLDPLDADKYPFELSGGMRQRVAIAQAIIMRPKILLMDEPFGALDHSTRQEMQLFTLEQWQKHSMTMLFVTHDLEEACFLGTRIIGLSQYWSDDPGKKAEGARIVNDKKVPGEHPKPTDFKYASEFQELLRSVRRDVLDPDHCQHLSEFDHDHRDAWHPTRGREKPKGGSHDN